MFDTNRALTPMDLYFADIDNLQDGLEEESPAFIRAFCELLAIQQERKAGPIVVAPRGPKTFH
jgi:hypothetical protein